MGSGVKTLASLGMPTLLGAENGDGPLLIRAKDFESTLRSSSLYAPMRLPLPVVVGPRFWVSRSRKRIRRAVLAWRLSCGTGVPLECCSRPCRTFQRGAILRLRCDVDRVGVQRDPEHAGILVAGPEAKGRRGTPGCGGVPDQDKLPQGSAEVALNMDRRWRGEGDTQWFLERARARHQRYIAHLVSFLGRSPEFGNSSGSAKLRQVKEAVAPARQPSRLPQLLGG